MSAGDVTVSGPLFDGRADIALGHACAESERQIAIIGASMVRTRLNRVLRKQTPYYRLQVEAQPEMPGWKIWDQDVVYGPWLEGTGSRNKTTRFKGYFTFRLIAAQLQRRAAVICEKIITTYEARWHWWPASIPGPRSTTCCLPHPVWGISKP